MARRVRSRCRQNGNFRWQSLIGGSRTMRYCDCNHSLSSDDASLLIGGLWFCFDAKWSYVILARNPETEDWRIVLVWGGCLLELLMNFVQEQRKSKFVSTYAGTLPRTGKDTVDKSATRRDLKQVRSFVEKLHVKSPSQNVLLYPLMNLLNSRRGTYWHVAVLSFVECSPSRVVHRHKIETRSSRAIPRYASTLNGAWAKP